VLFAGTLYLSSDGWFGFGRSSSVDQWRVGWGTVSDSDQKDRPTASGHRFGPELTCSECGVTWDEHQANPAPCTTADVPSEPHESNDVGTASPRAALPHGDVGNDS
jgi:hypothetical protein